MSLRAALRYCFIAATVAGATGQAPAHAQGQNVGANTSSRQAEDRRVDESARQTQASRQTEAPKPQPSFGRQPEPQRQVEPRRQPEPQRQQRPEPERRHAGQRHHEPSHQDGSPHWTDPGPAWRAPGPAWRNSNERQSPPRPGADAFRATPRTYAPRDRGRRNDGGGKNVYIPVPYPVYLDYAPYNPSQLAPEPAPEEAPSRVRDDRPLGFLTLRVQPRTAEVYVDGAFAGTVDDFGGRGARLLPAGPHRVEILADGYETLTFDVRVPEDDTVTFTRDLEPRADRAAEPIVVPHKTMYIVPRCFIGDRMPLPGDMPAGCRVEDVRVIP